MGVLGDFERFEWGVGWYARCPVPATEQGILVLQTARMVGWRSGTDGNGYLRTSWLVCYVSGAGNKTGVLVLQTALLDGWRFECEFVGEFGKF